MAPYSILVHTARAPRRQHASALLALAALTAERHHATLGSAEWPCVASGRVRRRERIGQAEEWVLEEAGQRHVYSQWVAQ